MTDASIDLTKFRAVFFPFMAKETERVKAGGARFAYYTSAEVAASILSKEVIWMRNAAAMNDFSEVQYGTNRLRSALQSPIGGRLMSLLDSLSPGLSKEVIAHYSNWEVPINADTYVTCVSHHTGDEDLIGRLSMWRAYGRGAGVALVLNGDVMFRPTTALGVFSSPVLYADQARFNIFFLDLVVGLETNLVFLKSIGVETVKNAIFEAFRYAVLCTKHPGFAEEREWRAIASPMMYKSSLIRQETEVVGGVPQVVVKLPLANAPAAGLTGLHLSELLDRVIIGPCEHPLLISRVFFDLLSSLGFKNIGERLVVSDIPLRQRG